MANPVEYRVRQFKMKQSAEELEAMLNAELGPEGWTPSAVMWAGDDRYNAFFTPKESIVVSPPVNTTAPAISGVTTVGNELSVTNGAWDNAPTSYAYLWQRNGADIPNAVNPKYRLVLADANSYIVCIVSAANAGGSSPAPSNQVGPIAPAPPVNVVAPAVSGAAIAGETLTTTNGTWGNAPTGYTYQWRRDGTDIAGATSNTYVSVAPDDVGAMISCVITATNAGGSTSKPSNAVGPMT